MLHVKMMARAARYFQGKRTKARRRTDETERLDARQMIMLNTNTPCYIDASFCEIKGC